MDDVLLQRLAAIVQIAQFILSILISILLFFWKRRSNVWDLLLKKPKVTITILLVVTMISSLSSIVFFAQPAFRSGQAVAPNTLAARPTPTSASSANTSPTVQSSPTVPATATVLPDGKVLCEYGEAKGWSDWTIQSPSPWYVSGPDLLHDGSRTGDMTAPTACQPTQLDYAVEMKMIWGKNNTKKSGLFVQSIDDKRYLVDMDIFGDHLLWEVYLEDFNQSTSAPPNLEITGVHTYRVEVSSKSNLINLRIDNRLIASFQDYSLLKVPGKVGIYSIGQIKVVSFRVILLKT